jgi:hypothetical protein
LFVQGGCHECAYILDGGAVAYRIEFHYGAGVGFDFDCVVPITGFVTSQVVAEHLDNIHGPEQNVLAGIGSPGTWGVALGRGILSTAYADRYDQRESDKTNNEPDNWSLSYHNSPRPRYILMILGGNGRDDCNSTIDVLPNTPFSIIGAKPA